MSTTLSLPRFRPSAWAALSGIYAYQRWLSPRKGYRCAHGVLHGGPGCSGYAKERIAEVGLWKAIPDIRQRFADCGAAADTIVQQRRSSMSDEQRARARASGRRASTGCCDGPTACFESLPFASCCLPGTRRRRRQQDDDAAIMGVESTSCCLENAPLVGRCCSSARGRSASNTLEHGTDCGDLGCDGIGDCAGCAPG